MNEGLHNRRIRMICWVVGLLLTGIPRMISAQVPATAPDDTLTLAVDSIIAIALEETVTNKQAANEDRDVIVQQSPFKPNPRTATIASAIFPGVGQYYNRQYWKLPLVYGGLMGCAYAITWNNRTYQDYKRAYYSIMIDAKADPQGEHPENWSDDWKVFITSDPANYLHNTTFHNNLKRGKDYYRRYRDMSIIFTIAFWGICVADAYVDAQMFDFDVSPDLSFHITPQFLPETFYHSRCYGINICMNF